VGLDFSSIAVPLDSGPVRAIRADPQAWEEAQGRPPFGGPWPGEELPAISRELLAVTPAGAGWVGNFGDRSYQQAEYLLDPAAYRSRARTWEARERTTEYRVIHGEEYFAEHARSGQGIRWRCSSSAFLAGAVATIDGLDVGAVRREFSVAEMDRLGLYKVRPEETDEDAFERVLAGLRDFGEHCRRTVARDLGLIITLF
jgi:hypothetical protein